MVDKKGLLDGMCGGEDYNMYCPMLDDQQPIIIYISKNKYLSFPFGLSFDFLLFSGFGCFVSLEIEKICEDTRTRGMRVFQNMRGSSSPK
jgi:hypothetical protein